MRVGERDLARHTWIAILPVLPYLVLTLRAGGPHQHRLRMLSWRGTPIRRRGLDLARTVGSAAARLAGWVCGQHAFTIAAGAKTSARVLKRPVRGAASPGYR